MRSVARVRNAARRAVFSLIAIAGVLLAGVMLPLDDRPGTSWAFLLPVLLFSGHSVLGLLVLLDGARLTRWSRVLGGQAVLQAGTGAVACLLAVVAGAVSLAGAGSTAVRPAMAVAWLVGLGVYGRLWWSSSEALHTFPGSHSHGT
jgi:hypothetical protein